MKTRYKVIGGVGALLVVGFILTHRGGSEPEPTQTEQQPATNAGTISVSTPNMPAMLPQAIVGTGNYSSGMDNNTAAASADTGMMASLKSLFDNQKTLGLNQQNVDIIGTFADSLTGVLKGGSAFFGYDAAGRLSSVGTRDAGQIGVAQTKQDDLRYSGKFYTGIGATQQSQLGSQLSYLQDKLSKATDTVEKGLLTDQILQVNKDMATAQNYSYWGQQGLVEAEQNHLIGTGQ